MVGFLFLIVYGTMRCNFSSDFPDELIAKGMPISKCTIPEPYM